MNKIATDIVINKAIKDVKESKNQKKNEFLKLDENS